MDLKHIGAHHDLIHEASEELVAAVGCQAIQSPEGELAIPLNSVLMGGVGPVLGCAPSGLGELGLKLGFPTLELVEALAQERLRKVFVQVCIEEAFLLAFHLGQPTRQVLRLRHHLDLAHSQRRPMGLELFREEPRLLQDGYDRVPDERVDPAGSHRGDAAPLLTCQAVPPGASVERPSMRRCTNVLPPTLGASEEAPQEVAVDRGPARRPVAC